jgi:uncharacterized HAD superfamily protein
VCLSCGCGKPTQDHGDDRHVTLSDLLAAARAAGAPPETAAQNIPRTLRQSIGAPERFANPMTRPALIVDIDGILAFAQEAIACAINARFGTHLDAATMTYQVHALLPDAQAAWLRQQFEREIYVNMAPDLDAIHTVNGAHDAGWTVIIATARPPQAADVTLPWLDRWGVKRDATHLVGHGNKPTWVTERFGPDRPAILLDDSPAYQIAIARPGIEVWTPRLPYTPATARPYVRVFDGWPQIAADLGVTF